MGVLKQFGSNRIIEVCQKYYDPKKDQNLTDTYYRLQREGIKLNQEQTKGSNDKLIKGLIIGFGLGIFAYFIYFLALLYFFGGLK